MKTVYVLKVRENEKFPWSDSTYYRTRKERDNVERINRCLGGIRTHSYEEKKTQEEIEELVAKVAINGNNNLKPHTTQA